VAFQTREERKARHTRRMSAHPIDAELEALAADMPRISDAMKNWCSVLAAADLSAPSSSAAMLPPHEIGHLLEIAKHVLRCINAHHLLAPEQWALQHPQASEESAADRIAVLTRYRACHALAGKATAANTKVSKMLGRGFLAGTRCWPDVRAAAEAAAAAKFPQHTLSAFLDGWGKALESGSLEKLEKTDDGSDSYATLVWAADFQAALLARRQARAKEVADRRERMESGANEAEQLREALRGEEGEEEDDEDDEEDDGPRVIELAPGGRVISETAGK